ncbi:MAG: tetratricopeptide repeat protein [Pirellulales bacterium]
MVGRTGRALALACTLALLVAHPLPAGAAPPGAAERFRAAAALQERELFDLAAADYAAIERDFPSDSLADRAGLACGVCLFQLGKFDDACAALQPLVDRGAELNPGEREQLLATLGLAAYNAAQSLSNAEAQQRLDTAIAVLGKYVDEFSAGRFAEPAFFYRAEALYARGRTDEAAAAYRALLDKMPQHPQRAEAFYGLAVAEQALGNFAASIEACSQFEHSFRNHSLHPDIRQRHAAALLSLAEVQRQAGKQNDARQTAQQLLDEFPESADAPPACVVLAQLQIAEGDLPGAESSLTECLRRSTRPEVSRDALLLRARVRHDRGDHAGSLSDACAILAREPRAAEALHLRGLAEVALGKPLEAANSFAQVLEADPNYGAADRVLYELGWAYEQDQQTICAIEIYARLIESQPTSPLAAGCQFRLGQLAFAAEHFQDAADHFRDADLSTTDPSLSEKAQHQRGWSQFQLGDYAEARHTFAAQIAALPAGSLAGDAQAMAGECSFKLSDFSAALESCDLAIDDTTTNATLRALSLVRASQSAAELQDWARSLGYADRAIQEFPAAEHAEDAHYSRGLALLELGRLDESQRELTLVAGKQARVLSLKAELALGRIHVARGERDEAVRVFFKVAYGNGGKAAPESFHACQSEAIFAAARVLEDSGRHDAAHKLYEELLSTYPTSPRATLARQALEATIRR